MFQNGLMTDRQCRPDQTPSSLASDFVSSVCSGLPVCQNTCLSTVLIFCYRFTKVPEVLYKLPKLEIVFVNDNKIDSIDAEGLKQLPALATLDLQNNSISQIPPELGLCTQLK